MTATKDVETDPFDLDMGDLLGDAPAVAPEPVKPKPSTRRRATCPDGVLFFDLETIPDYSRLGSFDLPPIPSAGPRTAAGKMLGVEELRSAGLDAIRKVVGSKRPDDTYLAALEAAERADKKPRAGLFKLIDELRDESNAIAAAESERRKIMSVCPEMNRIVAFGWAWENDVTESYVIGGPEKERDANERYALGKFWSLAKRAKTIVGFNVLGFDLPTVFTRSALLGVEPSRRIDLKPWGGDVCDLMAVRWPKGTPSKLKTFARRLGIPVEAGDVDGSQVEELLRTDARKLGEYNRSDVSLCREIYLMGRGLWW